MDRWKSRGGSERRREEKERGARKGRKVAKDYIFPMICGCGGPKSRLAKAAGGQLRDEKSHAVVSKSKCTKHTKFGRLLEVEMSKKCASLWREAHFQVKMYKTHDHFSKLRCRKSARRCGAKHMSKSKCTKHTIPGTLLEVEMSKKCTPLWREAHFQFKNAKKLTATEHFWMFRCGLAWQAQGIVHLVKSEQKT